MIYNIQLLDIESKGADYLLLYSIPDQLKYVKRIRCDCYRSSGGGRSYWKNGDVDNDCDRISEYLRKHEFQVDYIRVKNCGLSEFRLQASKKPSLAAGALMTMMHQSSSTQQQNTGVTHQGGILPHYMVVFVVRVTASGWSDFEHLLKPSIETFVNKRQFQVILLLDPLSNFETGAGTDAAHIHHLEQHHYHVKHLSAEHVAHDDWIYYIDYYVESTIDIIGVLGVKDTFHSFVTMSNLIDEEGKLLNVAVYSPQAINSKAHHTIPKLDDQYDMMTVSHSPKLFYRSTFEHLRHFLVKQYRAESLQEIWAKHIQTIAWPILNIVFNYALQFENEKYKVILPQDNSGILSIASGDQNIDKKFGCCHVFGIYAGKDCAVEKEEETYKQESKALLRMLLINGTVISPKYEDRWNLVQEHYQIVKLQLKKMNRYHIKRMSQLCSKN